MIIAKLNDWILLKRDLVDNSWQEWDIPHSKVGDPILTKEIFCSCPFLDYIFQNQEVLFIVIVGSVAAKLTDDWSDYDLIVFTKNFYKPQESYKLIYKNWHIHWYYKNINTLAEYSFLQTSFYHKWGLFAYQFIDEKEHLLYLNPKYSSTWQTFRRSFQLLAKLGVIAMKEQVVHFINCFLEYNSEFQKALPLKYYYHFIDILYYIKQIPRNIEYLKRIKRMEYNPLSDNDFIRFKQDLIECKELFEHLDWDQKTLIKEWNTIWGIEDQQ